MSGIRDRLRSTPSITGSAPDWDPGSAPEHPRALFLEWLMGAIDAGVPEPHAAILSTVGDAGAPDARMLVIKDVTDDFAIDIATGLESAKGRQLLADPRCALTFYWTPLARSIRVRGTAVAASPDDSGRDFLARHLDARAIAATERQSSPMHDVPAHVAVIDAERARIVADPGFIASTWSAWHIRPTSVEFWQGERSRDHLRLQYTLTDDRWECRRLWP